MSLAARPKDIPEDWWCGVHRRHLSYHEWKTSACWWCQPEMIPKVNLAELPKNKEGKLASGWDNRIKEWDSVRNMTPEQRAPKPLPWWETPGARSPTDRRAVTETVDKYARITRACSRN